MGPWTDLPVALSLRALLEHTPSSEAQVSLVETYTAAAQLVRLRAGVDLIFTIKGTACTHD